MELLFFVTCAALAICGVVMYVADVIMFNRYEKEMQFTRKMVMDQLNRCLDYRNDAVQAMRTIEEIVARVEKRDCANVRNKGGSDGLREDALFDTRDP